MLIAPAIWVYAELILKNFEPLLATLAPLFPLRRLKFDLNKRRAHKSGQDCYNVSDEPLAVRSPVCAHVGYEVLKSCRTILSEDERIRVPVLVTHYKEDWLTNVKGRVDFHDPIGSRLEGFHFLI